MNKLLITCLAAGLTLMTAGPDISGSGKMITYPSYSEFVTWPAERNPAAFTGHVTGDSDLWFNDADNDGIKVNPRQQPPSGCTVITFSKGDTIFFAGNDDYINADSYYWVEPGDSSRYGVVWIGTPDNPQQGVNEKLLAYDANGLPRVDVNPHSERIPFAGEYYHQYLMQIMHECSTVEEVMMWVGLHQRPPYMHDQMHFADASGDAVIISAGADGEVVLTRKGTGNGFLVSSNFNVANPSNGFSYPCWRYDRAGEMLGQLLDREAPVNHFDITGVMDAVHVSSGSSWTIETMVADMVNGILYIYFFYQYDRPLILNIKEELASPRDPGPLSMLFPQDVRKEAARRYNKARFNSAVSKVAGISWPALVVLSIILLFTVCAEPAKGLLFWLPAVIILGPLALIVRGLINRRCKSQVCRTTLVETTGSIVPVVIMYTAGVTILVMKTLSGSVSQQLQVVLIMAVPFIGSWVYHLVFLTHLSNRKGLFFIHRLPQVLITTFLGLGGIIPFAMPLINKTLNMSLLIPLSPLAVTGWWAMVIPGSVAGGLLIYLFEMWEVKRGSMSWTVLAGDEGRMIIPPLRRLWWWIPVSLVIMVAGLILGVMLLR